MSVARPRTRARPVRRRPTRCTAGRWLCAAAALVLLGAVTLACAPEGESAVRAPPNIVVVIGDDQSWRDYGFMGSPVARTPHLDALAESGTVFTHAFTTASVCRPSLRSLLTGLEPQRLDALEEELRAEDAPMAELAAIRDVHTIPRMLGQHGYVSFQGGKHWEGPHGLVGFTEGTATAAAPDSPALDAIRETSGGRGLELGRSTMTPLFDFLSAHRDDRFLVWFAPMLPHTPHDPPRAFVDLYAETDLSRPQKRYFGNVTRLDARVGELLARLDDLGLRERTLVVYLADNGWDQIDTGGPVDPLLGGPRGKFSIHENGFRTPMIVSWPGTLPAGRRDDSLVSALDLMPTLLDFAGVASPPPDRNGLSLRGLLEGRAALPREQLIGGMDQLRVPPEERDGTRLLAIRDESGFFLREPEWRYVWIPERGVEALYAIAEDPWEQHDLAARHPERVARSRAAVQAWRRRMAIPAPTRKPAARASVAPVRPSP